MEKGRILKLIKKPKNGLLRIVFSRLVIVFLMLGLQIFLYIAFFVLISQFLPQFAVFQSVFAFGMVIYLFNNKIDSSAKLTWLALIAVLPLFGVFLLAYTQLNLGHRNMQKNMDRIITNTKKMLPQDSTVTEKLSGDIYCTNDLHRCLDQNAAHPICDGTLVHYYPLGDNAFPVMLEELEKAERFIFLEYFIIQEGYMWGRILDVLARKAAQGVDVRVMYDGTCEFSKLPSHYPQLLGGLGIKARMFAPLKPFLSSHYNYRDHRKIMVIDGKTTFSGGVDVKLILPGISDHKPAYALARSHYGELIDAGIGIYEYTPGMVHAKVCVSDDCRAVVGTINLDYRSLYHHFECAAYLYKVPCIDDIENDFQQTLSSCRKIGGAELKNERKLYNLAGALLKVIAPLM